MATERNPVAPKADVVSHSIVLLEGTLATLGFLDRKGFFLEVNVIASDTFTSRPGA